MMARRDDMMSAINDGDGVDRMIVHPYHAVGGEVAAITEVQGETGSKDPIPGKG